MQYSTMHFDAKQYLVWFKERWVVADWDTETNVLKTASGEKVPHENFSILLPRDQKDFMDSMSGVLC